MRLTIIYMYLMYLMGVSLAVLDTMRTEQT